MMCQLYRHFDQQNNLLYVGIAGRALKRLAQHKASPWFKEIARVEIEHCQTREYAQFLESLAVERERPLYNRVKPSYDPFSPTLAQIVIQEARNEAWVEAWTGKDVSEVLRICSEEEEDQVRALREQKFGGSRESRPASSPRPLDHSVKVSDRKSEPSKLTTSIEWSGTSQKLEGGAGVAPGPPKPKRGRPRIGEERDKPWLKANPPMSKTTWYRRQKEKQ